jgi:hypothetical protein
VYQVFESVRPLSFSFRSVQCRQGLADDLAQLAAIPAGESGKVQGLEGRRQESSRVAQPRARTEGVLLPRAAQQGVKGVVELFGRNPVAETIGLTMTPGVLVVGAQSIYLRGRSWRAKVLLIGGPLVVLVLIGLAAGRVVDG